MELVLAILARQSWNRLVRWVNYAVADHAVLNAFNFLVNVCLPEQHGRNNVSVSELQEVLDCQDPLVLLSLCDLELLAYLNRHGLERVVVWDLDLQLHGHFSFRVFCNYLLG